MDDFVAVFNEGSADAALAASIFHFAEITPRALKQHLLAGGIPMRWPC
jgi:cyclase